MAVSFKLWVFNLLAELFAHAFIFFGAFQTAGTVPSCLFQSVPDGLHHIFVRIQRYFHSLYLINELLQGFFGEKAADTFYIFSVSK